MADFKIGSTKPTKVYIGSTEVKKIYIGSTEVWSSGPTLSSWIAEFQYEVMVAANDFEVDNGYDVWDQLSNDGAIALISGHPAGDGTCCIDSSYTESQEGVILNNLGSDFKDYFDFLDIFNVASSDNAWNNFFSNMSDSQIYLLRRSPDWDDEEIEEGSGYVQIYEYIG